MESQDTVTVAPAALITIARKATMGVSGVARMGSTPGGVGRLLRRTPSANGVRVNVQDNSASIELYVILKADTRMREVGRSIQQEVARAVQDIVGLDVTAVDVYVEDVDFSTPPA